MMRAKTEQKVKRWKDQRWLIDSVIQAVGMEWDQPRLNYTMYPAGPDAIGDFRTVGLRVRKFADMHREFAAAAHRREVKAQNFEKQGRNISARESYFIASLLYSAARWPIFESNAKSIDYNARMVACYDKFAALMNRADRAGRSAVRQRQDAAGISAFAARAEARRKVSLRHRHRRHGRLQGDHVLDVRRQIPRARHGAFHL